MSKKQFSCTRFAPALFSLITALCLPVMLLSTTASVRAADPADGDAQPSAKPDASKQRRLMIVPFENISSVHMDMQYEIPGMNDDQGRNKYCVVDRFSEAPRADLEEILTNLDGVTVCERTRVDAVLQEQQFGGMKGITDPKTACEAGKLVGASTIIIGTLKDISGTEKQFVGNGIRVQDYTATAEIQVRVVDIASGTVQAKKTFTGTATTRLNNGNGNGAGADHSTADMAAIKDAMEQVAKDETFLKKVAGPHDQVSENYKVHIDPKSPNVDVFVDDAYQGSAPQDLTLAAGKRVKIVLRKAGYNDWVATLAPHKDMDVEPELEKKATETIIAGQPIVVAGPTTQPSK